MIDEIKNGESTSRMTGDGETVQMTGCLPRAAFRWWFVLLIGFIWWSGIHATCACSIPVFRYALDRWPADAYRLEVSVADAQNAAVAKFLRNLGTSSPYNVEGVRLGPDAGQSRLLFPPDKHGERHVAWEGTLNEQVLERIVESPVRRQVVDEIVKGASGVWVLAESGDKAVDDAAATTLEKRLRYLEQVAQLPRIDPNDPTSKLGPGPKLQVKFTLLRVPKSEFGEALFLKLLAGTKDLENLNKGAWVAAIFGRGRVLGAWPAVGFGDEQVEEVCLFLLGACSCQVKNLNPGWDLLLSADWERELGNAEKNASATTDVAPLVESPAEPAAETVQIQGATIKEQPAGDARNEGEHARPDAGSLNWTMVSGTAVLALAAVCFLFGGRLRR